MWAPLWIERMHNRAQSGYSTEQPTQIQTAEWFLSSNYASVNVHDVHMCVLFFFQISGSLFCLQCVFSCQGALWDCEFLSVLHVGRWICEQIWTYELSNTAGGPGQDSGYAGLSPSWPGSTWGSPQRCCEVKSGPLWLGHWTPQAEPRGHSSCLRLASSILFSPQF